MNKYIIPICDIDRGKVWIKTVIAKSNSACQEKLMAELIDLYDMEDTATSYREFIKLADSKYNILIGDIKDTEEL